MSLEKLRMLNDHDLLIHIATKVEELTGNGQPGIVTIHGRRLNSLEGWKSYVNGALIVIGFILSAAVTISCVLLAARLKVG